MNLIFSVLLRVFMVIIDAKPVIKKRKGQRKHRVVSFGSKIFYCNHFLTTLKLMIMSKDIVSKFLNKLFIFS